MRFYVGLGKKDPVERLEARGINRRDFMKFCAAVATVMGLGPMGAETVAAAVTNKKRPSVVYLHFAECTGCSESVLRTAQPFIDELILDTISMDYQETIMAAAGAAAEDALKKAVSSPDGFILVCEGAVPLGQNGDFGYVGGHTMASIVKDIAPKAKATICIGACATYGGIQAAKPNPTGAKSVQAAVQELTGNKDFKTINIAGCPPNPINFVGTVVQLLTKGMPELDTAGRPKMFYGLTVHEQCERLPHFEAGEFAKSFDDETAKKGYCLFELGCKGPVTYNNCPKALFNGVNWPVGAGHPCIGCSEPAFWDQMTPFYEAT